jgi:putative transposase
VRRFIGWLGIAASKFHDWAARCYGSANEHNALVTRDRALTRDQLADPKPANEHNALVTRDWWLEPWEKAAIAEFHKRPSQNGDRLRVLEVLVPIM